MAHYLMFESRFVAPIQAGTKRQTIRVDSRVQPGDTLSLRRWTGRPYRSPQHPIVPAVRVVSVQSLTIFVLDAGLGVFVAGEQVHDVEAFARADGFNSEDDMAGRYRDRGIEHFNGVLIRWEPIEET